mgnify:CR=1 FL=1
MVPKDLWRKSVEKWFSQKSPILGPPRWTRTDFKWTILETYFELWGPPRHAYIRIQQHGSFFFYVKKKTKISGFFHFLSDWSRFSKIGENWPGLLFNFLNFKNTFVFEFSIFSFVFRSGQIRTCPDLSGFCPKSSKKN